MKFLGRACCLIIAAYPLIPSNDQIVFLFPLFIPMGLIHFFDERLLPPGLSLQSRGSLTDRGKSRVLSNTEKLKDWFLMMKVSQGCKTSFNTLFAEYHPRLLKFLRPRLNDPHTVEAVASDTLLTARDKANQFLATSQLSTWLFGIAIRKAMRVGDREGRRQGALPEVTYNESVNGTNQESRSRELGDLIRAGITRLPDNQKRALALHLIEGYSLEETANRLGIPLGTAKTRIFEARKQLKLTLS